MKSIVQREYECFVCKRTDTLTTHHIYAGSRRKRSDEEGLTVKLCPTCHERIQHHDAKADLLLKQIGQRSFEKTHTRAEFISLFGKNYLH
jgi:uncharacterized protein YlaI